MTRRQGEDGFTLIEALVAMAVLAVGAVGLLTAVERHADLARGLGDRTVARWAAQNRLTGIVLGLAGTDRATESLMGVDWRVDAALTQTNDPDLTRIEVTVGDAAGRPEETLVRLTGFVDVAALPDGGLP